VKLAVAAGLGIGVLSTHTLQVDVRAGDIVILPCVDWSCARQFWLVQRRDRRPTRAQEAFVRVPREGIPLKLHARRPAARRSRWAARRGSGQKRARA
jgi:DNA-binding transcriptional LysR family regulator